MKTDNPRQWHSAGPRQLMGALLPAQAQDWEATLSSWTGRPAIEPWRI